MAALELFLGVSIKDEFWIGNESCSLQDLPTSNLTIVPTYKRIKDKLLLHLTYWFIIQ